MNQFLEENDLLCPVYQIDCVNFLIYLIILQNVSNNFINKKI